MPPYDMDGLVPFMTNYFHTIIVISSLMSFFLFYLIQYKTPRGGEVYGRYLIWVMAVDFVVCFLLVPVPLFPIFGSLCFGVFCQLGGNPNILVVLACATVGYVGAANVMCFHYRYESVLSIARAGKPRWATWRRYAVPISIMSAISLPAIGFAVLSTAAEQAGAALRLDHPELERVFANNISVVAFPRDDALFYVVGVVTVVINISIVVMYAKLAWLTLRELAKHSTVMSERTRNTHKTLVVRLLVQVGLLNTLLGGSIAFYAFSVYMEAFSIQANCAVLCIQMLFSIVHTLLVISLTDSYRIAALRCFRRVRTPAVDARWSRLHRVLSCILA